MVSKHQQDENKTPFENLVWPHKRIIADKNYEYVLQKKLEIGGCQIQNCAKKVSKENSCCFDYDHLDIEMKVAGISNMVHNGSPTSLIDEEIKKCRLLCASSFSYVSNFKIIIKNILVRN